MTNPQKTEILEVWRGLKEKIKKDNLFGPSYQHRLGLILQSLEYKSLRPNVDWEELELAIKLAVEKFKRKKVRIINHYCEHCQHCKARESEPFIEEVD